MYGISSFILIIPVYTWCLPQRNGWIATLLYYLYVKIFDLILQCNRCSYSQKSQLYSILFYLAIKQRLKLYKNSSLILIVPVHAWILHVYLKKWVDGNSLGLILFVWLVFYRPLKVSSCGSRCYLFKQQSHKRPKT